MSEKKLVRFVASNAPYVSGDVAGFDEDRANALIDGGVAVEHKETKKSSTKKSSSKKSSSKKKSTSTSSGGKTGGTTNRAVNTDDGEKKGASE